MILLFMILVPLLGGLLIFNIKDNKTVNTVSLAISILTLIISILAICLGNVCEVTLIKLTKDISLSFILDDLSKIFVILVCCIWAFVSLYAQEYIEREGNAPRFFGFYLLTLSTILAIALSANVVTFYMFFELMALLSMPMVLHDLTEKSRVGAYMYLGYSTLGASLALAGFFILNANNVSLTFNPGGNISGILNAPVSIAYILIFIGLGAKAGVVPLQMWLTEAHPVAPSPASAVLSGLITKAGVVGIIRITFYIYSPKCLDGTWMQTTLIIVSLITIFFGSMLALREKVLKRRLAYSTISNVSYVLFGLLVFNMTAFAGAILQVIFHALAKCTLFLSAGNMVLKKNKSDIGGVRGVGKKMPITMLCFTFAAFSLVGIPPFGGFTAKWYLAIGALKMGNALSVVGVIILLISALLTAFYLFSISVRAFFPGDDFQDTKFNEVSTRMLIAPVSFACATLVFGLFNEKIYSFIIELAEKLM